MGAVANPEDYQNVVISVNSSADTGVAETVVVENTDSMVVDTE